MLRETIGWFVDVKDVKTENINFVRNKVPPRTAPLANPSPPHKLFFSSSTFFI